MGGGGHESLLSMIAGALVCTAPFDCNLSFDKYGGIILWLLIMLYMFKALGAICDEYFVPSLEVIVEKLQLSNDVAGATFMAAGSSAPELFTSLVATFLIVNEGGVGTIVGSAIFNILIIVGVTCYVACKEKELPIWWYPLSRDAFFYALSIGELMWILHDEKVEWYEGVVMIISYISYCIYMKFNPLITKKLGLSNADQEELVEEVDEEKPDIQIIEPKGSPSVEELRIGAVSEPPPGPPDHRAKQQPQTIGSKEVSPGTVDEPQEPKSASLGEKPLPPVNTLIIMPDKRSSQGKTACSPRNSADHVFWCTHELEQTHSPRASPEASPLPSAEAEKEKRASEKKADGARVTWGHKRTSQTMDAVIQPGGEASAPKEPEEPEEGQCSWCRDPLLWFWEVTMPEPSKHYWILFALSILYIGLCTFLMVDATSRVGTILHIPILVMALVFLAAGTSIPDALGSVAVARQGEGDMAVANALGSNVFDILVGLGVPWTIKCAMGKKVEFEGKWKELQWDIVILCAVLVIFIGALLINRWRLTRRIGIFLLVTYVFFLIYAVPISVSFGLKKIDES